MEYLINWLIVLGIACGFIVLLQYKNSLTRIQNQTSLIVFREQQQLKKLYSRNGFSPLYKRLPEYQPFIESCSLGERFPQFSWELPEFNKYISLALIVGASFFPVVFINAINDFSINHLMQLIGQFTTMLVGVRFLLFEPISNNNIHIIVEKSRNGLHHDDE